MGDVMHLEHLHATGPEMHTSDCGPAAWSPNKFSAAYHACGLPNNGMVLILYRSYKAFSVILSASPIAEIILGRSRSRSAQ